MSNVRASALVHASSALLALLAVAPVLGAQNPAAVASASPAAVVPAAAAPITWTPGTAFPTAIDHHVTFITSGTRGDFLHVIGGQENGRYRSTAWQAKIARDGKVGAWAQGEALPVGRAGMAFATDGRYALLAGGQATATDATQEVYLAHIWGDGRLGAWKAAPFTLPARRLHTGAAITNGFAYVIGGSDGTSATSTVYRAKIARTGELSAWTTLEPLPGPRSHQATFVHDGAIYLVGGIAGDAGDASADARPLGDVLRATVNKDGSLGAWQRISTLDAAFSTHAAVVKDGYLYVIGGVEDNARTSDRVLRAALGRDGSLGTWEVTASTLPAPRGHVCQVPVLRDHLFSVGGSREGKALDEVVVGRFGN